MVQFLKETLIGQYEAALAMLKQRIEACPPEYWEGKVGSDSFRQIAYHALFFCDFYLTAHEDLFTENEFHIRGGNELRPVVSQGLGKEDTLAYIMICRHKILNSVSAETQESLEGGSGFPSIFRKRPISRLELHLYNIRHIQHHTGQLSGYLRRISNENNLALELPWVGTGWR